MNEGVFPTRLVIPTRIIVYVNDATRSGLTVYDGDSGEKLTNVMECKLCWTRFGAEARLDFARREGPAIETVPINFPHGFVWVRGGRGPDKLSMEEEKPEWLHTR